MLAEFSIFPIGKGESLSDYVTRAVKIVQKSGLDHQVTAMGTIMEGEWEEIMPVIGACIKNLENESSRIYCTIKIDWRKNVINQLVQKTKSIEEKM